MCQNLYGRCEQANGMYPASEGIWTLSDLSHVC